MMFYISAQTNHVVFASSLFFFTLATTESGYWGVVYFIQQQHCGVCISTSSTQASEFTPLLVVCSCWGRSIISLFRRRLSGISFRRSARPHPGGSEARAAPVPVESCCGGRKQDLKGAQLHSSQSHLPSIAPTFSLDALPATCPTLAGAATVSVPAG